MRNLFIIAILFLAASAKAEPVITSFMDGKITWTNDSADGYYRLEWAAGAGDLAWSGSWSNLARFGGHSNLFVEVETPRLWRVVWSNDAFSDCDSAMPLDTNAVALATPILLPYEKVQNLAPGAYYAVEFASGTNWVRDMSGYCSIPATGLQMTATIPMEFRLLLLDTNQALRTLTGMVPIYFGSRVLGPPTAQRSVFSARSFLMDRTEITIGHWNLVADWALTNGYSDLFEISGSLQYPASRVSWYDAAKWCNARSEMDGLVPAYYDGTNVWRTLELLPVWDVAADGYRLPTETEWEVAARGDDFDGLAHFPWGGWDAMDFSGDKANYRGSGDSSEILLDALCPVGGWTTVAFELEEGALPVVPDETYYAAFNAMLKEYPPNAFGLYDMAGNVSEWVFDGYGYGIWPPEDEAGVGLTNAIRRVHRGGSAWQPGQKCTVYARYFDRPEKRRHNIGFRCVSNAQE